MSLLGRIRRGTYVPDDDTPLASPGRLITLRETGSRITAGEDVLLAIRDFLDQVGRADVGESAAMIAEPPAPTGNQRADALLAAVAEYSATSGRIACPGWTSEPWRFLDRFWFVSSEPGFRAIALAQTPMSLKRHGIFWPARSLRRV